MQIHASCVARGDAGVLLLGPPGAGKSDLVLRLLDHGFNLVADDRVDIEDGIARAPGPLAGLLELRGLGIFRLPHQASVRLALAVQLEPAVDRLPVPERHPLFDLPMIRLDPAAAAAPHRLALALDCVCGKAAQVCGSFTA